MARVATTANTLKTASTVTPMRAGFRLPAVAVALFITLASGAAFAQTTASRAPDLDLGRILAAVPDAFGRVLEKGHTEFFRLVENLEMFRIESEIDRFVGKPRTLHDSTTYKLSLLPFHIRYPLYRQLVDQMTRLDTVRSNRIHMVTPDSVALIDLHIQPVATLDAFAGQGAGDEVQRSLLSHFSSRELADLSVFLLAQQAFFPESDDDWARSKRRIARAAIPLAAGALATGAAFDAGALGHSGTIVKGAGDRRLKYYAGFRKLGVSLRPYLRGGLVMQALGLEAAAGIADQLRPTSLEPDRALEFALREGWLNQLAQPLGMDAFFEAALRQSIAEPAGFVGRRTATRAGFFFRREQVPTLPSLAMRGSVEGESDLERRLHLVGALGVERSRSGIATMLHGSLVPASPTSAAVDDVRLSFFLVGTMEPISEIFAEEMAGLSRRCDDEWADIESLERRREDWERKLLAHGTAERTAEDARAMLAEMEHILAERESRLGHLAATLGDYLESRRRVYAIFGWAGAPDQLHGPLNAEVLLAARELILTRLSALSTEIDGALGPLLSLKDRMRDLEREIGDWEAKEPEAWELPARRSALAALQTQWRRDTDRVRHQLAARERLRAGGARILAATGGTADAIRAWDNLGAIERIRLERLALLPVP